ncbi:MAG: O-antigen ligase family protein [Patescibacteria group bacterium]
MFLTISKWFLYAAFFSVIIVITGTFFPFIGGKYYFFRTMVSLSLIAWLLWWAFQGKKEDSDRVIKDLLSRPLFLAVSLFVLMFLSAALFAHDPNGAFWSNFERGEGAFQMLHYYAFFVLSIVLFQKKSDWEWAMKLSLGAACLMILYGVLAYLFLYNQSWFCSVDFKGQITSCNGFISRMISPYQGLPRENIPKTLSGLFLNNRFQGSLGNPAYVAPYLMFTMAYALFLWSLHRFKSKHLETALYFGLIAIFFAFFIFSQTRGTFLGILAAGFVFLVYLFISHRPSRKKTGGVLLVGLIGAAIVFSLGDRPFIQQLPIGRLFNISLTERTAQTRLWTWNSAWQGFLDRPLLGWGPENFSSVFDKHFDARHFVPGEATETWFDRAHSILFDYLAETGLLGFLSFLGMFVVFYLQFFGIRLPWLKDLHHGGPLMAERFHLSPWAAALMVALPVGYLVQGLILFDVLPIYLNVFFFLAFASFLFKSGDLPLHHHQEHQS